MCGETNSRLREQLAKNAKERKGLTNKQRIAWLDNDIKWVVVAVGSKHKQGQDGLNPCWLL